MQQQRKEIESLFNNNETVEENIHPDRRHQPPSSKDKRSRHSKKVQVWIREDVIQYEEELKSLQIELLKLQNHLKSEGKKLLMLFEGRDAAGKGATIKRITEHINPRGARVVALDKPSDHERTQWYFQRYVQHLPGAGEIVLFDRSWYNRGGVEPVMGFCTDQEHKEFLQEVPDFEKMLVNSGIVLLKFYFSVSKKEQAKRFNKRKTDPLKQYKLSAVDELSQELWDKYTQAKYSMLLASQTEHAPWMIIRSDNKKNARINCIKHILNSFEYPGKIDSSMLLTDKDVIFDASLEIAQMERLLTKDELI